jgi:hypothetical protein
MQLLSLLGQYLLLAFVLPGFCYLAVFSLCFPGVLGRVFPGLMGQAGPAFSADAQLSQPTEAKKDAASQGLWITLLAVVSGLLLSSVAFWVEILLRYIPYFDCTLFPRIPFVELPESEALANFFTPEAFMHFNIGLGLLIILISFVYDVTRRGEWMRRNREAPGARLHACPPVWLTAALLLLVVANIHVSSHLFHRVHDIIAHVETTDTCKQQE